MSPSENEEYIVAGIAMLSMFASVGTIFTYFGSSNWRRELRKLKRIMLHLSIFTFLGAAAELDIGRDKSDFRCRLQGSLIQLFGVGGIFYEAFLSIETAIIVGETHISRPTGSEGNSDFHKRFFWYNAFVWVFGIATVSISNAFDMYQSVDKTDYVCYVHGYKAIGLMGFLPIVFCLTTIIGLDMYSWYCIFTILKNLIPANRDGNDIYSEILSNSDVNGSISSNRTIGFGDDTGRGGICTWWKQFSNELKLYVEASKRLDPITLRTLFRLLVTPIVYILLFVIPTLYIRTNGEGDDLSKTIIACTMVSTGIFNFVTWVLVDQEAISDLKMCKVNRYWELRESNSSQHSRPRSIYGEESDHNESLREFIDESLNDNDVLLE